MTQEVTMRNVAPLVLCACAALLVAEDTFAAGCVTSRGTGASPLLRTQPDLVAFTTPCAANQPCFAADSSSDPLLDPHGAMADAPKRSSVWQTTMAMRWFRSDRHFVGDDEQPQRQAEGSEVINDSRFVDFVFDYWFSERYGLALTLPYANHSRSQVVRANDPPRTILQRFQTQSSGFGDVRLVGNAWLLDPNAGHSGNVLLGLGVDAPTGEKDGTDQFLRYDAATGTVVSEVRTVDQSIQLGDGGWGAILELSGYHVLSSRLSAYVNGSYTITPQETNGVLTFRSNPFEATMSINDTYLARAGMETSAWPQYNLRFSVGGRIEGIPVHDRVGGSGGFRRPGYDVSIDPSVSAELGHWTVGIDVPVSVYRNRARSVPDEMQSNATGTPRHGDAAFADYAVIFAVARSFR
jgi:hypothetical protein